MPTEPDQPAARERYLNNAFLPAASETLPAFPLDDESHVKAWRSWLGDNAVTWSSLADQLPQLYFGVNEGISKTAEYRDVVLAGHLEEIPDRSVETGGALDVVIVAHWAGHLPVIHVHERHDFETLFRILAQKGEPVEISHQVHAVMIAGLVSPVRIAREHARWEDGEYREDPVVGACDSWSGALSMLDQADKLLFRDRLLVLQDVAYGDLCPADVGVDLDEREWLRLSRVIRQEHEFAHYATRRLFGNMRLNLHDELVARSQEAETPSTCHPPQVYPWAA